jgi:hypothetical protein
VQQAVPAVEAGGLELARERRRKRARDAVDRQQEQRERKHQRSAADDHLAAAEPRWVDVHLFGYGVPAGMIV